MSVREKGDGEEAMKCITSLLNVQLSLLTCYPKERSILLHIKA